MHTGNTISDLFAKVDVLCELARRQRVTDEMDRQYADELVKQIEAQKRADNHRICGICRNALGSHSHQYPHMCPNTAAIGPFFNHTRFQEIRCTFTEGRGEYTELCQREVVSGTERCKLHPME